MDLEPLTKIIESLVNLVFKYSNNLSLEEKIIPISEICFKPSLHKSPIHRNSSTLPEAYLQISSWYF